MPIQSDKDYHLDLKIAELNCRLVVNQKRWFNFLEKKYSPFLVNFSGPPQYKLNVTVGDYKKYRLSYKSHRLGPQLFCSDNLRLFRQQFNFFFKATYATSLIKKGGLLLHASAVEKQGLAYIFSSKSGGGKSTILKLSPKNKHLADDTAIIKKSANKYFFFTSPFYEKKKIEKKNRRLKIKGIFFLKKSKKNKIEPFSQKKGREKLFKNSLAILPQEQANLFLEKIWKNSLQISRQVPLYDLGFTNDKSFWRMIRTHV